MESRKTEYLLVGRTFMLYKNRASSYSQVDNDLKYLSLIRNCYNDN